MNKILLFIYLITFSTSVFSFEIVDYRRWSVQAPENEFFAAGLENRIMGTYDGLLALKIVSRYQTENDGSPSNIEFWCAPSNLALTYENLTNIIDDQLERKAYLEKLDIAFVLYEGLLSTFPCEG